MQDLMKCRFGIAVASFVLIAATGASAVPSVHYDLSGTLVGVGDTQIQSSSIIDRYTDATVNGGRDIFAPGPFDYQEDEVFDLTYANLRTFGYFGLLNTYDNSSNLTSQQFVIAAKPGAIDGSTFNSVFSDFLTAHPTVGTLANFISIIEPGADFPTLGANTVLIDFIDYVENDATRFGGNIATSFQSGQTLSLEVFNNTTTIAAGTGGTIQESATAIPEPASLALLASSGAMLLRRRR